MKPGDGAPAKGNPHDRTMEPSESVGVSHSGPAAVDRSVGGGRAPRVKRATLDEMVGLLNRELRDRDRVDEGRTPMRLVMHSGPAEALSGETVPTGAMDQDAQSRESVPEIADLPRPPRVPTIPGTRLLAPTVPSEPPAGARPVRGHAWRRVLPWLVLGLAMGLLFGFPLYRHLLSR